MVDRTPTEGSIYRHMTLASRGSVYNQRGEKVNDVVLRRLESLKIFKEGKRPEKMGFAEMWEAPDWMARPAHYYTDADWDFIKGVWANEKPRGAEPLYWEDVKVGDEPAWTVDGPIDESLAPTTPYGMGTGGSRTLRNEIMDPAIFATMVSGEKDGIYRLPDREDCVPAVPDGVVPFFMVDPDGRATGPSTPRTSTRPAPTARCSSTSWAATSPSGTSTTGWATTAGCTTSAGASCRPRPWRLCGKPVPENPALRDFLEQGAAHGRKERRSPTVSPAIWRW